MVESIKVRVREQGATGPSGINGLTLNSFTLPANGLTTVPVTVTAGNINNGDVLFGYVQSGTDGILVQLTKTSGVVSVRRYLPALANIVIPSGVFTVTNPLLDIVPIAADFTIPVSGAVAFTALFPGNEPTDQVRSAAIAGIGGIITKTAGGYTFTRSSAGTATSVLANRDYFTITGTFSVPQNITLQLQELIISALNFYELGYGTDILAIVDPDIRKAFAITAAYEVEIQKPVFPNGLSLDAATFAEATIAGLRTFQDRYETWEVLRLDPDGRLIYGIKDDGTFVPGSGTPAATGGTSNISAGKDLIATSELVSTNYQIFANYLGRRRQLTTSGDNTAPLVASDKIVYTRDTTLYCRKADASQPESLATSEQRIVLYADSYGSNFIQSPPAGKDLATLLGGRTIYRYDIGGQTTAQIVARQGAKPVVCTITGGQIPASGAVVITPTTDFTGTPSAGVTTAIAGSLAGVAGTVARDASNIVRFTRTTSGSVVNVASAPFIPDTYISAAGRDARELTNIFWIGRNGVGDVAETDVTFDAKIIDSLLPVSKRLVLLSVFTPQPGTNPSGYTDIKNRNIARAAAQPEYFYDIRGATIAGAKTYLNANYPGIWTTQSDTDVANDEVPTCLFADPVHINTYGSALVCQLLKDYLVAKGW